jgi:hypothetical protein
VTERLCIDCGKAIVGRSLRCEECKANVRRERDRIANRGKHVAPPRSCKDCGKPIGKYVHRCPECERQDRIAQKRVRREAAQAERKCRSCGGPIEKYRKRCHKSVRDAKRARDRRWIEENRERVRENAKASRRRNYHPEKQREKNQRYRRKPGVRERLNRQSRDTKILRTYGLTPEQYAEMTTGTCPICGKQGKLVLDHCHDTGIARGGLCAACNTGIGYFHDDPERMRRAASYLETSRATLFKTVRNQLFDQLCDLVREARVRDEDATLAHSSDPGSSRTPGLAAGRAAYGPPS